MTLNNHVIPFQLSNNTIRGNIVRLQTVVSEIVKRHEYPANIESLFADTLSITASLGSRMKHEGVFTIQAKGSGDVSTLFSDITSDGFLRGYISLISGFSNTESNLKSLMGSGHVSFTLDQGKHTKRYQGIVSLEEPSMSKITELYFNNSEQLETKFLTFNYFDIEKNNRKNLFSAGLIMLQKMPVKNSFDEESNEEIWQNSLNFLSTLGKEEFLSTNLTSEEILYRLFNELEVTVYDKIIIKDQCRCSDEKIKFAIESLSKKELREIADENGNVKVVCEFCKKERIFAS
jgi:molecular chaperone Hsp33